VKADPPLIATRPLSRSLHARNAQTSKLHPEHGAPRWLFFPVLPMRLKIFVTCFCILSIILALGGLVHRQSAQMGQLAMRIYDHSFIGMSYVAQAQEEFSHIADLYQGDNATRHAAVQRVIDRLDVALERGGSIRTRAAAIQARGHLEALLHAPLADAPKHMAQAKSALFELVKRFAADGLASRDQAETLIERSNNLVLVELAIAIGSALLIGWLTGRILVRPLAQLIYGIDLLAAGDLEHAVAPSLLQRHDEIGALAKAAMVFREAIRQNQQAEAERERQRALAETARRESAALELRRIRLLSDLSHEILIICRDGIILQVNAAASRVFEMPDEQLLGRPLLDFIAEADHPAIVQRLRLRSAQAGQEEAHLFTPAGRLIPVEFGCSAIDYEGKSAVVMAFRDLSERKRDEARIRHLAHHDALTDLPNRLLLREQLDHAFARNEHSGSILALLYLDLDRFKPVNDLLGHAAGDALLVQVAKRLKAKLRADDTVARIGGDEFVILVTLEQAADAALLAERLIEAVAQPFDLDGHRVEIGTSVGIALCPQDGDNQQALMRCADTALYCAKQNKRGTFRFFEASMDQHLLARQQLERDLRVAIEQRQFLLHYQPLINAQSGKLEGFEALLRWQHPERGFIPPLEFIPLAEENGLILEIGQWALETACEAAVSWREPYWVAVNVSPIQFRQSDLTMMVSNTLLRTGLPAHRLEIEITEGVLMDDAQRAGHVLSTLRQLGVRLALDDFGTGYSSLSYLHAFKFDKLKIDRTFIARLGEAEDATIIVRTIIGLAHNLGLLVAAEGVESPEQLAMLRDFVCDQVQGYLLGRPMAMDQSAELVDARSRMLLFGTSNAGTRPERADARSRYGDNGPRGSIPL
jgi:diguanylate cyclase (GGDEF)-like protein/PAS domain S-box-containing protein